VHRHVMTSMKSACVVAGVSAATAWFLYRRLLGASQIKTYYTTSFVPNGMLVDIFAREKGFDIEAVEEQLDLLSGENRKSASLKKNPAGQLPYFELADGKIIAETIAMCEYLEECIPKPSLIGNDAVARATTRMWQRRMEEHFVYPTFTAFRFWTSSDDCVGDFKGFFEGRAPKLIPEAWKGMWEWGLTRLKWLEERKKEEPSDFIVGDAVSIVDIQVYITLKFFAVPGFGDFLDSHKDELPWCVGFFDRMKNRASIKACEAHIEALNSK